MKRSMGAALVAAGIVFAAASSGQAAVYTPMKPAVAAAENSIVTQVQHWRGGPRFHGRGGPRFVGPGRYYAYRPWYRRPHFGTIIAGVTLGTIIGVTAYGLAPPRPRPDLCWYWTTPEQTRGYWDYC